jgi:tetratricopeptide (TPR) repeat protein
VIEVKRIEKDAFPLRSSEPLNPCVIEFTQATSPLTSSHMNTPLTLRTLILATTLCFPVFALAQDTEKQKIIDIITGELDAWFGKDREKWTNAIAHSEEFILTQASQDGYHRVRGYDSIVGGAEQHFATPVNPNVRRISKSDFKVTIKGSIAIVDLIVRGENYFGPFAGDQVMILEKQGKTWRALRQHTVMKTSYQLKETNIESGLNTQGMRFLEMKKFDEAIKVLTLNTELFPDRWNTWDSLAEAYMQKGELHIATGYFNKSIALNPNNGYAKEMVEKMAKGK